MKEHVVFEKLKKNLKKGTLDQRLRQAFVSIFAFLLVIVLIVSLLSNTKRYKGHMDVLIHSQLSNMVDLTSIWIDNIEKIVYSISLDENVQEYGNSLYENPGYTSDPIMVENLRSVFLSLENANREILYLAVVSNEGGRFSGHGSYSIDNEAFKSSYAVLNQKMQSASNKGGLLYVYNGRWWKKSTNSIVFAHPLYSTHVFFRRLGTILFDVDKSTLDEILNTSSVEGLENYLVDINGTIVIASSDVSEERTAVVNEEVMELVSSNRINSQKSVEISDESGTFYVHSVGKWNYYLVTYLPNEVLYEGNFPAVFILIFTCLIAFLLGTYTIIRIVKQSYQPIDKLVNAYDHAINKDLDYRIDISEEGPDFEALEEGYNSMMDTINELIVQVREEQHQAEHIHLIQLQEQIQPHFLYNTLECIHWQAKADGSENTVKLVKALASYYRLCLSKGKEIVTLSQELEHIRIYLLIQNARYGDIIQLKEEVDEEAMGLQIPKLTLQPLVENSIYHGIRIKEGSHGTIRVSTELLQNEALIRICDDGQGMDEEAIEEMNASISEFDESFGYGVRNVNRRIELNFGKNFGLHYKKNEDGGLTCEVRLPR